MQTNKSATEYLHLENTNKETIHYNDQIFVVFRQRFIIIDDFKDDLGYFHEFLMVNKYPYIAYVVNRLNNV